nr:glycosyltransferase [Thiorhodococcus minor]
MSLCHAFDGLSVANRALQQRHGGTIIRHARDLAQFRPSAERRRRARAHWQIAPEQQVVLFLGTPRRHKGLLETAQALASLSEAAPNLLFLIAGRFPASEQALRAALEAEQARGRLALRLLDDQPFAAIPDLLAAADIAIFLQDPDSAAARAQTPAKLSDALAMGLTVLAEPTPGLADLAEQCAFIPVSRETLATTLRAHLANRAAPSSATAPQSAPASASQPQPHPVFQRELSLQVNRQRLQRLIAAARTAAPGKAQPLASAARAAPDPTPAAAHAAYLASSRTLGYPAAADNTAQLLERLSALPALDPLRRALQQAPPSERKGVSVIILSLNGAELLGRLLVSFLATNSHQPVELIIVDHGALDDPEDQTAAVIARHQAPSSQPAPQAAGPTPIWHLRRGRNHSFSDSCNLAAALARYPNLLFLNNDIRYTADALPAALHRLQDPSIGAVGIRLDDDPERLPPGQTPSVQHLGIEFVWSDERGYHQPRQIRHPDSRAYNAEQTQGRARHVGALPTNGTSRDYVSSHSHNDHQATTSAAETTSTPQPAVTGAFLLCRRDDFDRLGGFSSAYDYGLEDIDFCLRLQRELDKRSECLIGLALRHGHMTTRNRDKAQTKARIQRNHQQFKARWAAHTKVLASQPPTTAPAPSLNLLFVLPQAADSNNGYHVQLHAANLQAQGVACILAVPDKDHQPLSSANPATALIGPRSRPSVRICSYTDALQGLPSALFANGCGPDLIYAWTPREQVRRCVDALCQRYHCPYLVHLEDNEEHLTEVAVGRPFAELERLPTAELDRLIPGHRYHPRHGHRLLEQAAGVTVIVDPLARFNTAGRPLLRLGAPVDERLFYPRPLNHALRRAHQIPESHWVLVYTGNVHAANQAEVAELYHAVQQLNRQGHPTSLLRTGLNKKGTEDLIRPAPQVLELGWVPREQLPAILAAADVLVQPGSPGVFNDQRLPSKLPESFAVGRPVVLSRSHLGLRAVHCRHAFVLNDATAAPIADAVRTIMQDPALKARLATGARDFYQQALRERGEHLYNFLCALANRQSAASASPNAGAPPPAWPPPLDDPPTPARW